MKTGATDKEILQKNLHRFLVNDVFNAVTEDELLRIKRSNRPDQSDVWYHKGEELPTANIEVLKAAAGDFQKGPLWKILKKELRYWAHQKGNAQAISTEDLISSKIMLYMVDVIDSKLNEMSR